MKTTKILSALCGLALMLGGCANDDITNPAGSAKAPGVYVRLAGAAGKSNTRAGEEEMQTADEKKVNSVLAVLFDTHYKDDASDSESRTGFYKTVDATLVDEATGEYSFIVEKDATYDIWLVANADSDLTGLLKGTDGADGALKPGATVEDFSSLIAAQAPDRQGEFLMVSTYSEKVTTEIDKTYSIGEVHMERLAARFDLVNKAEGVTVRKVTYGNRAVSSSLLTPNSMDPAIEYATWSTPDGFSLEGSKDPEATEIQLMYSYENVSKSGETTLPVISIEYEQDGAVRTHEVQLIDPDAPAGTVLPIKRNHLYRLVLTKAGKLNFNLEVADWEEADAFGKSDLNEHLILPPDEQQKLNEQLLVYDLFTEFNVKSLNLTDKTVTEFYDKLAVGEEDVPASSMFSYIELKTAGLTANGENAIIKDTQGNSYRLPTLGELMLLVPVADDLLPGFTKFEYNSDNLPIWHIPLWSTYSDRVMCTDEFTENVYLKNNDNGTWATSENIENESDNGFSGKSQMLRGKAIEGLTFSYVGNAAQYGYDDSRSSPVHPVYAVRFKGTNQCAAYRYQNTAFQDNPYKRYLSIRIKALPKDTEYNVYDIADNRSFWASDYIEVKIPLSARLSSPSFTMTDRGYGYLMSSTIIKGTNPGNLSALAGYCRITTFSSTYKCPVRLVKVNKESEPEEQK